MLEPFQEERGFGDSIKDKWESASPVHKLALAAVICLILAVGATYSLAKSSNGDWKPLFSHVSPERAGKIVEKLDEMGQPYRLGGDGSVILVPPTAVNRLRIELAAVGLLQDKEQGFELFESASLSRSDFSEHVTYLRALQGELAGTISSIDNVRKARVHLNLNQKPIFLDQQPESSAAVYVEMSPGTRLNENQIKGIISLVANSVEGLDESRVTLFDATGALQVSGADLQDGNLGGGDAANQSDTLSKLAQTMVDRILGPGKGLAMVRVEIDHKVRRVETESHAPGGDGKGVPIHREDTSESFEGTKPAGVSTDSGAPPVQVAANQAPGEKPKYAQQSSKVDYAVSKTTEVLEEKPGAVSRISASIIVDSNAGLTQAQLDDLAAGLKTALGLNDARGDKFELKALPFNKEQIELASKEMEAQAQQQKDDKKLLLYVLAGVGGTVVLGFFLAFFLKRRDKRQEVWMDVNVDSARMPEPDMNALEESLNLLLPAEEPALDEESTDELLVRALEEVERDPASVARLLERWVEGEP